jgi:hypothetical protein
VAADPAGITERRKGSATRRQPTDLDTYPARLTVIGDGRRGITGDRDAPDRP